MFAVPSIPYTCYSKAIISVRQLGEARKFVYSFMQDMVRSRRTEISGAEARTDILSLMIRANEGEGKFAIEDEALVRRQVC